MKSKANLTLLQKILPSNLAAEKRKFLFDPKYNPQFEYPGEIDLAEWNQYGPVADQYLVAAKQIIDAVIHRWGQEEKYLDETGGRFLSQEEVRTRVLAYLKDNGLADEVIVQFSSKQIARTMMDRNVFSVQLPVRYREFDLPSVLDHEVGTHYLRRINEQQQPWRGKHRAFGFGSNAGQDDPNPNHYLETEEGLAVLNYYLTAPDKHLWMSALYYYTVWLASQLSFAALFHELRSYVEDRERRWTLCLKTKRGLRDTSLPGAFTKNQLYFSGVIKVAHWFNQNDFAVEDLYLGKLALNDIPRAKQLSAITKLRLPQFVADRAAYRQSIQAVISVNKLNGLVS